jgi:hypothetical protein
MEHFTVREGEWNEAVCFRNFDLHPQIEIAAQKSGETWFIFYVTPHTTLTLDNSSSKDVAVFIAEKLANKILTKSRPTEQAWKWLNR